MKLCIRSHDLGVKDIDGLTALLDKYGLDGVQLVCYKTFNGVDYRPGGIDGQFARTTGAALRAAEKIIPLIGAYFNPVHSDSEKAAYCEQIFCDYIHNAGVLGSRTVGSETGSYNDDSWSYNPLNRTREAQDRVVQTFTRLCDYAAPRGINIGIEGAAGHVCWNVDVLFDTVNRINRGNLEVIFDLYNFLDTENYGDYLQILDKGIKVFGNKILLFHIKDFIFTDGKLIQCPPGMGKFDFKKILGAIKAHNENAVLVLEGTTGKDILPSAALIRNTWRTL